MSDTTVRSYLFVFLAKTLITTTIIKLEQVLTMAEESDSTDTNSFKAEASVNLLTRQMDAETATQARERIKSEFRSPTSGDGGYVTVTFPSGLEVTLGIEDMDEITVFPAQD